MWKSRLFLVCAWLAAAGPAYPGSPSAGLREPRAERCAGEIFAMHGVWLSQQVFLPAYGDMDLVVYLASLGARQAGVAVVPVFSSDAIHFRSTNIVFLSTALILKASTERELTEAIRNASVSVRTLDLPTCAAMAQPAPASFAEIQRRLAGQLAEYEAMTARRLRQRDE